MTAPTFRELGIPFQLFEAPAETACDYLGIANCSICEASGVHCFRVHEVLVPCAQCKTTLLLDTFRPDHCYSCGFELEPLPRGPEAKNGCYSCLRDLRFVITKGTELGMISYGAALRAITHGVPGPGRPEFEWVRQGDREGWMGARVAQEHMMELLRTPSYRTIQGEQWLFCCKSPMTFHGQWSRKDYSDNAPDGNAQAFFEKIVRGRLKGSLKDLLDAGVGIHVFCCRTCEEYSAHWDFD